MIPYKFIHQELYHNFLKEQQRIINMQPPTILAADAKIGCWYEDGRGIRLFCFNTEDSSGQAGFVVYEKSKDTFYLGWYASKRLTPLPDCDGWEPTPTYRPFTLQEIVEQKDRVWVYNFRSDRLELDTIEFKYTDTVYYTFKGTLGTCYRFRAKEMLKDLTFDDGTPCGVEVE